MVTMKDIARIAGTSVGTVSLALSGSSLVKLETRYRIQQIAKDLDYHPNQYARSLVTKETKVMALFRTSGVKYPLDDMDPFASNPDTLVLNMLPIIQKQIRKEGYSILVDGFTPEQARAQSNPIFTPSTIDGAFFFGGMIASIVIYFITPRFTMLGLGIYLPAYLSFTAGIGGLLRLVAAKAAPKFESGTTGTVVASGLLAGEGFIGVVIALIQACQILAAG